MRLNILLFSVALTLASASATLASVHITVHIPTQRMEVAVDGTLLYEWSVSTAAKGKITPTGTFKPYRLSEHHRSSLFGWAPMPHAVFYDGHYAIHGTIAEKLIGTPASKGCVRLLRENAKVLFGLVKKYGNERVTIVITK